MVSRRSRQRRREARRLIGGPALLSLADARAILAETSGDEVILLIAAQTICRDALSNEVTLQELVTYSERGGIVADTLASALELRRASEAAASVTSPHGLETHLCQHVEVLVDYEHPHGTIAGVAIQILRASNPAETRCPMTIHNARCRECGSPLTKRKLGARAQPGGDCFDERFKWI